MKNRNNNGSLGVRLEGLSKVFLSGDTPFVAVNNVSLQVAPGEMVTLLGPSGCGKTTILRMLSGFTMPTQGKILLDGQDVTDMPPHRRDVGMMFQSYALFPHLSVYENVAYGLRVKKVPAEERKRRVQEVLELMRIQSFADRIPEKLSGGQQQRVALARAIVTEPKILLFDEPLSNLDAKMREYMRDELRKIQLRLGITSIYVTHDQSEAMAISDKVVIMNGGIIEQIGSPLDIYSRPVNPFVADFMGKANFVPGKVVRVSDTVDVTLFGMSAKLETNPLYTPNPGDTVTCMLRPEFFKVGAPGDHVGVVRRMTYLGFAMEYELELDGHALIVVDYDFRQHELYGEGASIPLTIDRAHVRLLAPKQS